MRTLRAFCRGDKRRFVVDKTLKFGLSGFLLPKKLYTRLLASTHST